MLSKAGQATAREFEPLRAEPNGFLVHHLNHSVTLSMLLKENRILSRQSTAKLVNMGYTLSICQPPPPERRNSSMRTLSQNGYGAG